MYFSANVSIFYNADLVLGNLFCTRYKYKSLTYGLIQYPACFPFTVSGKHIPLELFFVLF